MSKKQSNQVLESPAPEPKEEVTLQISGDMTIGEVTSELKKLTADSREFTQQVHDAVVSRIATLESKVLKLASTVAGIRGTEKKFPRTKEYTVVSGDSLTLIAKKQLGQAGRFTEIAILNYDRYPSLKANPGLIQVGWKLRLPD